MTDNQTRWQRGTVRSIEPVAADIVAITVATERAHRISPGAHVDVETTAGVRSYSIVSGGDDGRSMTVGVRLSPTSRGGSRFMHSLHVGDDLVVTEPLQNFPLRIGAPRYLLVAGGIGITAIAAMASALARIGADYRVVYVGRSRKAMAFLPELVAAHGPRLTVHADDDGGTFDVDAVVADVGRQTELYMCGPIRLMDAIRRSWRSRELPPTDLRYETFGNSGWFDAEEFDVTIPRLGIETVVGPGESMLDALERAGADMMFDCKKGECGLCLVDVVDVRGTVDHRDVFFSDAQKTSSTKLCTCVSRVVGGGSRAAVVLNVP